MPVDPLAKTTAVEFFWKLLLLSQTVLEDMLLGF